MRVVPNRYPALMIEGDLDRKAEGIYDLMNGIGAQEICVTTAKGVCDFISAMDTDRVPEWNCWYHLLNCGFPLKVSGETGRVGITDYAQGQLGDIVFVDVPDEGKEFAKGDEAAVVESVKAASDVYAPASGTVIEGNSALTDDPSLVNSDPEGDGWFFRITLSDPSEIEELMDEDAYASFVKKL